MYISADCEGEREGKKEEKKNRETQGAVRAYRTPGEQRAFLPRIDSRSFELFSPDRFYTGVYSRTRALTFASARVFPSYKCARVYCVYLVRWNCYFAYRHSELLYGNRAAVIDG